MTKPIKTVLGEFDKEKFWQLVNLKSRVLEAITEYHKNGGYVQVTTSSLVNIAGSCENPYASFPVPYYGREAHLSQSAQLQLEALVLRLNRAFFTINNSFREENYDDPEQAGRRLSEFTLIEAEDAYSPNEPKNILESVIEHELLPTLTVAISSALKYGNGSYGVDFLGGDADYLGRILSAKDFATITYDQALEILNQNSGKYKFGDDLGIKEERQILRYFDNMPVFVTHHPVSLKFFNMKRTSDGQRTYSVDLVLPKLGETIGGGVREENAEIIKEQLLESRAGAFLREKGIDPIKQFSEYLNALEQEKPVLRAGYGIGFERLIGFLIGTNDILDTVKYRTLRP